MALMKYIQGDAHRFAPAGRDTGGKDVLVNDTAAAFIARSGYGRKRYLPRFPAEGMCEDTSRQSKANNVSWNVVRLDDIVNILIINVSPTREFHV